MMKKNLFFIYLPLLIFQSNFSAENTRVSINTYFVILHETHPSITKSTLETVRKNMKITDELIIDDHFDRERLKQCRGEYILLIDCNDEFNQKDFNSIVEKMMTVKNAPDEVLIPIRTYKINNKGQLIVTTSNELKIIKNTNQITRQRTNITVNEKDMLIYRVGEDTIQSLILKINGKDSNWLINFFRHENSFDLFKSTVVKNNLMQLLKPEVYNKLIDITSNINSILDKETIINQIVNLMINN